MRKRPILEKIYKDYEANKTKIQKNKQKIDNLNNINYILKTNFINNNISVKNKKNDNQKESKIIINEKEIKKIQRR